MISSEEAGVSLHISTSRIVTRPDMPTILVVTANYVTNDGFPAFPAVSMMKSCKDWELDGIEINGASKLNMLNVKLAPTARDPYYKHTRTYHFEFEMLTKKEVRQRKKMEAKQESHTHLRKFKNLITDDV